MNPTNTVIISVSSDLVSDQRVQKIAASLAANNYSVKLVGRKLAYSPKFKSDNYFVKRFSLLFNKGMLFYANLNISLFFYLLFSKVDVLYSNDLDTLPANFLVAKIRGKKLIYDSHEYFTEVPELIDRPNVQKIWERIEKAILPKLKNTITVSAKIVAAYQEKYGVKFQLMRNFPILGKVEGVEKENYIIYQGALNVNRGLEELIDAMHKVHAKLWIAGTGDIEQELRKRVADQNLIEKVIFLGRLSPSSLREYTLKAKLGVSIEHQKGLNYTYALPNKLFDYIHAKTPVLYADLIEVKNTLKGIEVGEQLKSYDASVLSQQLNAMLNSDHYHTWQSNCEKLSQQLNWQQEEKVLLTMMKKLV